jgi:hypothetical protein
MRFKAERSGDFPVKNDRKQMPAFLERNLKPIHTEAARLSYLSSTVSTRAKAQFLTKQRPTDKLQQEIQDGGTNY